MQMTLVAITLQPGRIQNRKQMFFEEFISARDDRLWALKASQAFSL